LENFSITKLIFQESCYHVEAPGRKYRIGWRVPSPRTEACFNIFCVIKAQRGAWRFYRLLNHLNWYIINILFVEKMIVVVIPSHGLYNMDVTVIMYKGACEHSTINLLVAGCFPRLNLF